MPKSKKSWKTTAAAIIGVMTAVGTAAQSALDGNPETVANWNAITPAIVACVGLLFSKDADAAESVESP